MFGTRKIRCIDGCCGLRKVLKNLLRQSFLYLILGEEEGREKLLSCLNSGGNCAPFSTDLMRYLQVPESAEEIEDDSGLVEVPERRSSYLFRSRRSPFDPKRSSTYLWRTRKAYLDPRGTRGKEYLFRTRKMDPRLATRGNYLFRTRKADALMDRMLRSSKSYLFRTR